ncbi:MAG: hypothetical protein JRH20_21850 [Deltaproteobacteria bacterium]|nr:hypothetical protein [Deltaproteobacteria bacterium]
MNNNVMGVSLPKDFDGTQRLTLHIGDVLGKETDVLVVAASRTLEIIPAEHQTEATAWTAAY